MYKNSAINIRIPEHVHIRFKAYASYHGETMASLILDFIEKTIAEWDDINELTEILQSNEPTISWDEVQKRAGF